MMDCDRQSTLTVEGRTVRVQAAHCDGFWWVDFALSDTLASYMQGDRTGPNPWLESASWAQPRTALASVWTTLITMTGGQPIAIECSDGRRANAYTRLLRRAGMYVTTLERGIDDTVLYIKGVGSADK